MNDDEKKIIGNLIRTYMSENGMSREGFAYKAGISVASVNNVVRGILTEKMLDKIEHNISYKFRSKIIIDKIAPPSKGGYKFSDYERYVGNFELIRRDFQEPKFINVFAMKIDWSEDKKCLSIFHRGIDGSEYLQGGELHFPHGAGYFFIVSNDHGWQSDCIVEKMDFERCMDGCIFSLNEIQKRKFGPVLSMFVLRGVTDINETQRLEPSNKKYKFFQKILENVDQNFIHFSGFTNREPPLSS